MKRRLFPICILIFFGLMLLFPKLVFAGASKGLLLWFQIILPTLLPFLILSNLLLNTPAIHLITRITSPLLCRFFGVSSYGSFAILTGFLCGYPMGSKVTADLIRKGEISRQEGRYLLSFCNNTSPMFLISFVMWQNLKNEALTGPALFILVGAPILCSLLFRRWYHLPQRGAKSANHPRSVLESSEKPGTGSASVIDSSIMNGFETITKVGGYIMLFSVLLSFAKLIPVFHPAVTLLLLPSLELTNGITMIASGCPDLSMAFVLSLALTSFGGWCSIAQTRCMLSGTGLSIRPYIAQKLITAVVTSFLACCFLFIVSVM